MHAFMSQQEAEFLFRLMTICLCGWVFGVPFIVFCFTWMQTQIDKLDDRRE